MGEIAFVKIITDHARTLHPTLTREQAFTKLFTSDDAEGQAIRKCWLIVKSQGLASGPLDETEVSETADGEDDDALAELNDLAEHERRRNPRLSRAQSFAKVYAANPELAAKERRQNRPRA
jgi:hypothetical protein